MLRAVRIKTSLSISAAAVIAAGGVLAGIAIGHGSGGHTPQLNVHQDAATSSVSATPTSSAARQVRSTTAAAAPQVAASTSTPARRAAVQQLQPAAPDTTTAAPPTAAPENTMPVTPATTGSDGALRPPPLSPTLSVQISDPNGH